jgi:hypothetical protein
MLDLNIRVLGFKTENISVATKMGEFRIGIQLFNWSTNLLLNKIWIEHDKKFGH